MIIAQQGNFTFAVTQIPAKFEVKTGAVVAEGEKKEGVEGEKKEA